MNSISQERFEKVGSLGDGVLFIRALGSCFELAYSNGEAFVNEKGTVAYNSLRVDKLVVKKYTIEEMSKPERKIFEDINGNKENRVELEEHIQRIARIQTPFNIYIFFSQIDRYGIEDVMTHPELMEMGRLVKSGLGNPYELTKGVLNLEQVYKKHIDSFNDIRPTKQELQESGSWQDLERLEKGQYFKGIVEDKAGLKKIALQLSARLNQNVYELNYQTAIYIINIVNERK